MESPPGVGAWGLDIVPLGAMLLTIWTVPVMASVVVIGHGVVRLWSWLRREDVPSAASAVDVIEQARRGAGGGPNVGRRELEAKRRE